MYLSSHLVSFWCRSFFVCIIPFIHLYRSIISYRSILCLHCIIPSLHIVPSFVFVSFHSFLHCIIVPLLTFMPQHLFPLMFLVSTFSILISRLCSMFHCVVCLTLCYVWVHLNCFCASIIYVVLDCFLEFSSC